MPSLRKLSENCFIFHHDGKLIDYKQINLYEKFKALNPKKSLIEALKREVGTTYNPLESGFILEDGTLIKLGKKNNHNEALKVVKGFSKFMNCHIRSLLILHFLIWRTNSLRIYIRNNSLAVQVWAHQKITNKQWQKLDFIISLVESSSFFYDIITILNSEARYFQEVKNPHNSLMMRKTYEFAKREIEEKGILQHLNYI